MNAFDPRSRTVVLCRIVWDLHLYNGFVNQGSLGPDSDSIRNLRWLIHYVGRGITYIIMHAICHCLPITSTFFILFFLNWSNWWKTIKTNQTDIENFRICGSRMICFMICPPAVITTVPRRHSLTLNFVPLPNDCWNLSLYLPLGQQKLHITFSFGHCVVVMYHK